MLPPTWHFSSTAQSFSAHWPSLFFEHAGHSLSQSPFIGWSFCFAFSSPSYPPDSFLYCTQVQLLGIRRHLWLLCENCSLSSLSPSISIPFSHRTWPFPGITCCLLSHYICRLPQDRGLRFSCAVLSPLQLEWCLVIWGCSVNID